VIKHADQHKPANAVMLKLLLSDSIIFIVERNKHATVC